MVMWRRINNYPRTRAHFMCMSRCILLWPEGIDISVIVLCRRLLRRMCIAEGSLALDTPQNKSRSRLLFLTYDIPRNNVDINSGLDWPQTLVRRCQFAWCNGYRHRKWTRWHEFKSWTRLIAFHIALIPLGKVWIQLFSLQLWINSRAD